MPCFNVICYMHLFLTIFIRNPLYCNYSLYACFIAIKKQGDLRSITSQPLDTPCTHSSTMRCSMYAAKLTYKWSSDNAKHSMPQNVQVIFLKELITSNVELIQGWASFFFGLFVYSSFKFTLVHSFSFFVIFLS